MWSGACPHPPATQRPRRPCTYPSVKALLTLFPVALSCTLLATEKLPLLLRDSKVGGPPGTEPESFGGS